MGLTNLGAFLGSGPTPSVAMVSCMLCGWFIGWFILKLYERNHWTHRVEDGEGGRGTRRVPRGSRPASGSSSMNAFSWISTVLFTVPPPAGVRPGVVIFTTKLGNNQIGFAIFVFINLKFQRDKMVENARSCLHCTCIETHSRRRKVNNLRILIAYFLT